MCLDSFPSLSHLVVKFVTAGKLHVRKIMKLWIFFSFLLFPSVNVHRLVSTWVPSSSPQENNEVLDFFFFPFFPYFPGFNILRLTPD